MIIGPIYLLPALSMHILNLSIYHMNVYRRTWNPESFGWVTHRIWLHHAIVSIQNHGRLTFPPSRVPPWLPLCIASSCLNTYRYRSYEEKKMHRATQEKYKEMSTTFICRSDLIYIFILGMSANPPRDKFFLSVVAASSRARVSYRALLDLQDVQPWTLWRSLCRTSWEKVAAS